MVDVVTRLPAFGFARAGAHDEGAESLDSASLEAKSLGRLRTV